MKTRPTDFSSRMKLSENDENDENNESRLSQREFPEGFPLENTCFNTRFCWGISS